MKNLPKGVKRLMLLGGATCTMYGGLVLWKETLAGKKYEHKEAEIEASSETKKPDVDGKMFVVTGANSGIGRELVYELASRKAKVVMACRDLAKCEEARKGIVLDTRNRYVYCRKCDLNSFQSIRDFVADFSSLSSSCDGLVHNAGVMRPKPRQVSTDGLEVQLQTNHTGPLLLTHLLRQHLRQAQGARVIHLINLDYRKGKMNWSDLNSDTEYDPAEAFNQSQLANMLAMRGLAPSLLQDGITLNCVYPGVCSTDIKRHMGVDRSVTGSFIANPILWLLTKTASRGAQGPLHACIHPSLEGVTGRLLANMETMDIDEVANDDLSAKKILAISKYWAGITEKTEIKLVSK